MKTILIIAGTRPEIIKTAPVVLAARGRKDIRVRHCLTGQHKTMAKEIMKEETIVDQTSYAIREKSSLVFICRVQ